MAKRTEPPCIDGEWVRRLLLKHIPGEAVSADNLKRAGGQITGMKYQPGKTRPELSCIYAMKSLMHEALDANDSNIWKKGTWKEGLKLFNRDKGYALSEYCPVEKKSEHLDDEAARFMLLFRELTLKKRSIGSGDRTPEWLVSLCQKISMASDKDTPDKAHLEPCSPRKAKSEFQSPKSNKSPDNEQLPSTVLYSAAKSRRGTVVTQPPVNK